MFWYCMLKKPQLIRMLGFIKQEIGRMCKACNKFSLIITSEQDTFSALKWATFLDLTNDNSRLPHHLFTPVMPAFEQRMFSCILSPRCFTAWTVQWRCSQAVWSLPRRADPAHHGGLCQERGERVPHCCADGWGFCGLGRRPPPTHGRGVFSK